MRHVGLALLIGLVVLGAWRRLHDLGDDSLWFDEAVSWVQSRGSFQELIDRTAQDNYPPLHNIFLFAVIHTFGDSEFWLRLPSVVLGTMTIPAVYWVGCRLHSRQAGLFAAAILSLAAFHVDYSQEARMYALLALAATLHVGAALSFVAKPNLAWGSTVAVSGAALVYTHPFGVITWLVLLVPFAAAIIWSGRRSKRELAGFFLAQLVVLGAFLPWALILLHRADVIVTSGFWLPRPSLTLVLNQLNAVTSGEVTLLLVATVLAARELWHSREAPDDRGERIEPRWALIIILVWAGGPWLIGEAVSVLLVPLVHERYLIGSVPALALLIGVGVASVVRSTLLSSIVAVALTIGAGIGLLTTSRWHNHDWRSAVAYLDAELKPGDCVALVPGWISPPFDYYARGQHACVVGIDSVDAVANVPSDTKRVFMISQQEPDLMAAVTAHLEKSWPRHTVVAFSEMSIELFEKDGI